MQKVSVLLLSSVILEPSPSFLYSIVIFFPSPVRAILRPIRLLEATSGAILHIYLTRLYTLYPVQSTRQQTKNKPWCRMGPGTELGT